MNRNPVVDILCSENRRALYIGITTDLGRRLDEHRRGLVPHTARYNIHRLIYFEPHETAPEHEEIPSLRSGRDDGEGSPATAGAQGDGIMPTLNATTRQSPR